MIITGPRLLQFMLVLGRVVGLFIMAPILSERTISQTLKIALAVWVAFVLWTALPAFEFAPHHFLIFGLAFIGEFFIGFLMGFVMRIIFMGIQFGGSLMDMQMGLSVAAAFDPSVGGQTTIMSRIMFFFGTVVFLIVNGHHLVLVGLMESFRVIPLVSTVDYPLALDQIAMLGGQMFLIGLTIAIPIMIIIFMLDFSLGLLARLAPQVNVFFLGFQVKPILGLAIFTLLVPMLGSKIHGVVEIIAKQIVYLLSTLQVT